MADPPRGMKAARLEREAWMRDGAPRPDEMVSLREEFAAKIAKELDRAYAKHGREPWSRHEFYAILLEEVDELWDAIKGDEPDAFVVDELAQVAAMCFRYYETGERVQEAP